MEFRVYIHGAVWNC